jgi:hypothetical protein
MRCEFKAMLHQGLQYLQDPFSSGSAGSSYKLDPAGCILTIVTEQSVVLQILGALFIIGSVPVDNLSYHFLI